LKSVAPYLIHRLDRFEIYLAVEPFRTNRCETWCEDLEIAFKDEVLLSVAADRGSFFGQVSDHILAVMNTILEVESNNPGFEVQR
jgi:hypothetical protein